MIEEKKPIGFLKDNLGDNSSKRLTGFILLGFFLALGIFSIIFDALVGVKSIELVKYMATISLGGSMTAFGMTLPEILDKK